MPFEIILVYYYNDKENRPLFIVINRMRVAGCICLFKAYVSGRLYTFTFFILKKEVRIMGNFIHEISKRDFDAVVALKPFDKNWLINHFSLYGVDGKITGEYKMEAALFQEHVVKTYGLDEAVIKDFYDNNVWLAMFIYCNCKVKLNDLKEETCMTTLQDTLEKYDNSKMEKVFGVSKYDKRIFKMMGEDIINNGITQEIANAKYRNGIYMHDFCVANKVPEGSSFEAMMMKADDEHREWLKSVTKPATDFSNWTTKKDEEDVTPVTCSDDPENPFPNEQNQNEEAAAEHHGERFIPLTEQQKTDLRKTPVYKAMFAINGNDTSALNQAYDVYVITPNNEKKCGKLSGTIISRAGLDLLVKYYAKEYNDPAAFVKSECVYHNFQNLRIWFEDIDTALDYAELFSATGNAYESMVDHRTLNYIDVNDSARMERFYADMQIFKANANYINNNKNLKDLFKLYAAMNTVADKELGELNKKIQASVSGQQTQQAQQQPAPAVVPQNEAVKAEEPKKDEKFEGLAFTRNAAPIKKREEIDYIPKYEVKPLPKTYSLKDLIKINTEPKKTICIGTDTKMGRSNMMAASAMANNGIANPQFSTIVSAISSAAASGGCMTSSSLIADMKAKQQGGMNPTPQPQAAPTPQPYTAPAPQQPVYQQPQQPQVTMNNTQECGFIMNPALSEADNRASYMIWLQNQQAGAQYFAQRQAMAEQAQQQARAYTERAQMNVQPQQPAFQLPQQPTNGFTDFMSKLRSGEINTRVDA